MNPKYILPFFLLIFSGFPALFGAPSDTEDPFVYESAVSFSIRYFDKRVYYLDTDPVFVQLTLTNGGPAPFRFKLADERAFSIDFDVRTTTNRAVDAADILVRRRSQSQQVYFREISLAAGESFSFVEDLREYTNFTEGGSYVVQARIYTELHHPQESADFERTLTGITPGRTLAASGPLFESNRLALVLRPSLIIGPDGIPLEMDRETNAILARERLSPDEVIRYLLEARQKSQWERFFLYLDLEAMLTRDSAKRREWNAESEEGRKRMIARYRADLQSSVIDGDISLIPMDFTIERTVYDNQNGTVTVLEYFRTGSYTEKKRYTWYLEKEDDFWIVAGYSVVPLGTE